MLEVLYKAIFKPLDIINNNKIEGRFSASVATVVISALFGTVIAPAAYYYMYRQKYTISLDIEGMLIAAAVSFATFIAVCAMFWLFARAYRKDIAFKQVVSIWGLSYIPNFLCIVLYYLLMLFPGIYDGSGVSAFILGTLFILLLVWKAIYYFMFLKCVMDVTLKEFIITAAVSAAVFAILLFVGMKAGIQVPMI